MIEQELLKSIKGVSVLYAKSFARSRNKYGLTQNEADVLLFLNIYPEHDCAKKICELRNLPKSNVSVAIDRLVRKGFLSYRADESDRRIVRLRLEQKADEAVKAIAEEYREFVRAVFDGFTADELEVWETLEGKIRGNISKALRSTGCAERGDKGRETGADT